MTPPSSNTSKMILWLFVAQRTFPSWLKSRKSSRGGLESEKECSRYYGSAQLQQSSDSKDDIFFIGPFSFWPWPIKSLHSTQLKGMMMATNQNHLSTQELRKRFWQTGRHVAIDGAQLDYQLQFGMQLIVCQQFFHFIICLKPDTTKWKSLCDSLKTDCPGPRRHGLTENNNNP